jgi:Spy/CpxP family protein refolding chaperone
MSPKKVLGIFLLSLTLCGSWAWAESWKEGKDARSKAWERIHMIKMLKLTEALKLDRETAARFFAVDNRYEEGKRKLRRDLHENIHRLRNLMQDMNPPEGELRELLSRIKNRKKDLDDLVQKQTDEEMSLLKPAQQARYVLFQIDFQREMQDLIREIREGRPPKPGVETPTEKAR